MVAPGTKDIRHLDQAQQQLLRAALISNQPQSQSSPVDMAATNTNLPDFLAPEQTLQNPLAFSFGDATFGDYIEGDTSFDVDPADLTLDMEHEDGDIHDKRKVPDDDDDDEEENDSKRQEGEDKQAKKPGRKPLTSEPTTKRKAQNRAAQRAFRERKEKHLKDLETKVAELTKSSESEKQANGLLRAQVARLQTELKDYRKRMAADPGKTRPASNSWDPSNQLNRADFAFEFPIFGQLPNKHFSKDAEQSIKREGSNSPNGVASLSRHASAGQAGLSGINTSTTKDPIRQDSNASHSNSMQSFAGLFSPGILNGAASASGSPDYGFPAATNSPTAHKDDGTPHSGIARAFRFNSESGTSNTHSPSQSSMSQFNANSSANTSPAPSHPSPPKDTVPSANPGLASTDLSSSSSLASPTTLNGLDWLASQNGGQFDPVLFGDYRESQDAIVGDGDFNNGFFNEAFPFDFGSPLNFSDTKSPQPLNAVNTKQTAFNTSSDAASPQNPVVSALSKESEARKALMAAVDKKAAGCDDNYGLATYQQHFAPDASSMLSANKIWNQLQTNKSFQDGKFDLDGLCSELRSKAKCSQSGIVVPQKDVEEAFKKMSDGDETRKQHSLLFDEAFVDQTIAKLGGDKIDWGGFGLNMK